MNNSYFKNFNHFDNFLTAFDICGALFEVPQKNGLESDMEKLYLDHQTLANDYTKTTVKISEEILGDEHK